MHFTQSKYSTFKFKYQEHKWRLENKYAVHLGLDFESVLKKKKTKKKKQMHRTDPFTDSISTLTSRALI